MSTITLLLGLFNLIAGFLTPKRSPAYVVFIISANVWLAASIIIGEIN